MAFRDVRGMKFGSNCPRLTQDFGQCDRERLRPASTAAEPIASVEDTSAWRFVEHETLAASRAFKNRCAPGNGRDRAARRVLNVWATSFTARYIQICAIFSLRQTCERCIGRSNCMIARRRSA